MRLVLLFALNILKGDKRSISPVEIYNVIVLRFHIGFFVIYITVCLILAI